MQVSREVFTLSPQTINRDYHILRKLRSKLSDMSSETKLARFERVYGHKVKLSVKPDLIIDNKSVDVKRPHIRYKLPAKREFFTFMSENDSWLENLSNPVRRGLKQNVDIIALHVIHLDRRDIAGFKTSWLGKDRVDRVLSTALSCNRKGTLLLFKEAAEGYLGKLGFCRAIR